MSNGVLVCQKCGKEFQTEKGLKGQWLIRKFCPDCSVSNQMTKNIICKNCGKIFTVGRTADGRRFIKRSVCDECLTKPDYKIQICEKCGKEFKIGRSKVNGLFLYRKICFDCDTIDKNFRLAKCVTCGKEFKQYRTPYGDFSITKYCSYECSLIQKKTKVCEVCGKEFELERSPVTNRFMKNRKYCSDECAQKGWELKTKKTCQAKYGVNYPCFTPQCATKNPTKYSKINAKFADLLLNKNIDYIAEFDEINGYFYDFYLPDNKILIEINPTFTHTCAETGVYPPLSKTYHYDKTKIALDNGFKCLCIWDWDKWNDIIELINKPFKLEYKGISMHWSRNNEHILNDGQDTELMLAEGWLPIYDNGYEVIL